MIAHFYIVSESFARNDRTSLEDIERKIKKQTNKIYVNYDELYPQIFYINYTMEEFVCEPLRLKQEGVDRDIIASVQKILDRSSQTTVTNAEVLSELINWNDGNDCHGVLVFNKINGLDENFQVVYDKGSWLKFRRYFLSLYPKNAVFFVEECEKYFPEIIFHPQIRDTIGALLADCPVKIIYHLSALNDNFRLSQQRGFNRTQVLQHFSANNGLDETASLEGNASRKKAFTFSFTEKDKKTETDKTIEVCCEPHMKLCYNDYYPGDNSYSTDRRIYFHEGMTGFLDGKILLGHIGSHL